jgi:hypothetical protein
MSRLDSRWRQRARRAACRAPVRCAGCGSSAWSRARPAVMRVSPRWTYTRRTHGAPFAANVSNGTRSHGCGSGAFSRWGNSSSAPRRGGVSPVHLLPAHLGEPIGHHGARMAQHQGRRNRKRVEQPGQQQVGGFQVDEVPVKGQNLPQGQQGRIDHVRRQHVAAQDALEVAALAGRPLTRLEIRRDRRGRRCLRRPPSTGRDR